MVAVAVEIAVAVVIAGSIVDTAIVQELHIGMIQAPEVEHPG